MFEKIFQIWKLKDLRNNILFVLLMLAIARVAAHIPLPGVDVAGLKNFFANNQILGLMNILRRLSGAPRVKLMCPRRLS